jgi:hypothetical protein
MPSGFFQADHGTGFAFGINAACVLSVGGKLVLFGGIPAGVDCAFHSLRVGGAVLVSAAQKGERVTRVSLQALVDGPLSVLNPYAPGSGANGIQICGTDGTTLDFKAVDYRGPLDWTAKAGVVYEMRET